MRPPRGGRVDVRARQGRVSVDSSGVTGGGVVTETGGAGGVGGGVGGAGVEAGAGIGGGAGRGVGGELVDFGFGLVEERAEGRVVDFLGSLGNAQFTKSSQYSGTLG